MSWAPAECEPDAGRVRSVTLGGVLHQLGRAPSFEVVRKMARSSKASEELIAQADELEQNRNGCRVRATASPR